MRLGSITYDTPFGWAWIDFDAAGEITQLGLPGSRSKGRPSRPPAHVADLATRLEAYWRTGRGLPGARDLPALAATPLLVAIYTIVSSIPAGRTMTYAEVARRTGSANRSRAVGAAMARNRFAPLIPCHRVVGSDGSLRGYAGGIEMKRYLLELERSDG